MNPEHTQIEDPFAPEIVDDARRRARQAWAVAGISIVLAVLAMTAVIIMLPLKEAFPYVIEVDKATGEVNATTVLTGFVDLDVTDAMRYADLTRYVVARETYDQHDLDRRGRHVRLTSTRDVWNEWDAYYRGPDSPYRRFGDDRVEVEIISVTFANPQTALVRYAATRVSGSVRQTKHYVAIVGYTYTNQPLKLKDRQVNPLGFVVTSYRTDQETL